MAFKRSFPGFFERTEEPTAFNKKYVNINYDGFNKCVVRNTSNGFVLPNCTGYCWGRALETTKSLDVDLSINQASIWFQQNKTKWDNGTGGYPYIDFQNLQINLTGELVTLENYSTQMKNALNTFLCPGAIVCYGQGLSRLTQYTYDENGHVQSIEAILGDKAAYEKRIKNKETLTAISIAVASALATWLVGTGVGYAGTKGPLTKFIRRATRLLWGGSMPGKPNLTGLAALVNEFTAWAYSIGITNPAYTLGELQRHNIALLAKLFNGIGQAAVASAIVLFGSDFLVNLLSKDPPSEDLKITVSESFYSGQTTSHAAWELNTLNLGPFCEYMDSHRQEKPNLQGIILVPPELRLTYRAVENFPWPLVQDKL